MLCLKKTFLLQVVVMVSHAWLSQFSNASRRKVCKNAITQKKIFFLQIMSLTHDLPQKKLTHDMPQKKTFFLKIIVIVSHARLWQFSNASRRKVCKNAITQKKPFFFKECSLTHDLPQKKPFFSK